jgi:hypothetical protein
MGKCNNPSHSLFIWFFRSSDKVHPFSTFDGKIFFCFQIKISTTCIKTLCCFINFSVFNLCARQRKFHNLTGENRKKTKWKKESHMDELVLFIECLIWVAELTCCQVWDQYNRKTRKWIYFTPRIFNFICLGQNKINPTPI